MYPPNSPVIDQIANEAGPKIDAYCQKWRIEREIAMDIVKLSLYDIIIYIDDSGSMQFEENGERISDLKVILERVVFAATLFDRNGISIRFMNSNEQGDNVVAMEPGRGPSVAELLQRIQYKGLTPMGTSLKNKVLEPLVVNPARAGRLEKPVLIITITDGQPAGESQTAVFDAIRYASTELQRNPRYGKGAVAFQFAQVGNDLKAREFLGKLDEEPGIGDLVDCTSSEFLSSHDPQLDTNACPDFEVEQDEMSRANPPVDLTPDLWVRRLLFLADYN